MDALQIGLPNKELMSCCGLDESLQGVRWHTDLALSNQMFNQLCPPLKSSVRFSMILPFIKSICDSDVSQFYNFWAASKFENKQGKETSVQCRRDAVKVFSAWPVGMVGWLKIWFLWPICMYIVRSKINWCPNGNLLHLIVLESCIQSSECLTSQSHFPIFGQYPAMIQRANMGLC